MDNLGRICHTSIVFNSVMEARMALNAHLAELGEKHRLLERKIQEEMSRPGSSDADIRRMKSEKLKIKDEIARLEARTRH